MPYKPEKSGEFGAKLKQMIAARGLSDRAFAKQCNLEPSYLSKLLKGQITDPRRQTQEKLEFAGPETGVLATAIGRT